MSRHTLNDGVTPDERLKDAFDFHWPLLAPSARLVGAYCRHELAYPEYEQKYLIELGSKEKTDIVDMLVKLALLTDVSVLCIEEGSEECHRRTLAEECKRRNQNLKVHIE